MSIQMNISARPAKRNVTGYFLITTRPSSFASRFPSPAIRLQKMRGSERWLVQGRWNVVAQKMKSISGGPQADFKLAPPTDIHTRASA